MGSECRRPRASAAWALPGPVGSRALQALEGPPQGCAGWEPPVRPRRQRLCSGRPGTCGVWQGAGAGEPSVRTRTRLGRESSAPGLWPGLAAAREARGPAGSPGEALRPVAVRVPGGKQNRQEKQAAMDGRGLALGLWGRRGHVSAQGRGRNSSASLRAAPRAFQLVGGWPPPDFIGSAPPKSADEGLESHLRITFAAAPRFVFL